MRPHEFFGAIYVTKRAKEEDQKINNVLRATGDEVINAVTWLRQETQHLCATPRLTVGPTNRPPDLTLQRAFSEIDVGGCGTKDDTDLLFFEM